MMFYCMPPSNRYEWCNLVGFVDQYSELHKKKYRPVEFPELKNRNSKEPEVLLKAEGGQNPCGDRAKINCAAVQRQVLG